MEDYHLIDIIVGSLSPDLDCWSRSTILVGVGSGCVLGAAGGELCTQVQLGGLRSEWDQVEWVRVRHTAVEVHHCF